ncbi:OPT oligopeptide transporter [Atractiella rhizophila]|nr:OPT oligopeptide transporter [Atractiella rhizophila]
MADIQPTTTTPAYGDEPIKEKHLDEDIDEKSLHDEKAIEAGVPVANIKEVVMRQDVGDVWSDRAIDMDETGHERPIETDIDYATRLVSLDDDPEAPWFTFRSVVLSLGLACFGAVLGQLFYFRPQTVSVSQLFLQVLAFLLGRFLERIIPGPSDLALKKTADTPFWRFMNHGQFNIKEHVAIIITASTASESATAISIFAAQDLYYNVKPNAAVGIFTLLGSQLIGYGLCGIMRNFLVFPTYAIYPMLVPTVQLFDAMHRGQGVFLQAKRKKFFWGCFIGIFIWEWFPEYIAPTLTGVSIFCLANQDSAWFTRIFGGAANNEGLGLFSLCFDWVYIGSGGGAIGSLFTPLSTQLSLYGGVVVCIVSFCLCYEFDVWHAKSFPFLTQQLWHRDGTPYDQLAILNDDFTLNHTKLEAVGLPWYAASQLLYKVSRTMYIGAMVTHFALWHAKDVWNIIRKSRTQESDDPHYQKMKVYKEVPWYWYIGIFIATNAIALATIYTSHSQLPFWGLWVALILAAFFLPIVGTLYCTVGYAPSIQNLVQMVGGAIIPGKPVANMYFTLYGFNTVTQAYGLLRDLKLGQYTKLPPRATFTVQCVGTVVGALLNYVIMRSVIAGNRDVLLDTQGTNVWSGQQVQSFNSAAIAWGALAKPLYAPGQVYGFVPFTILAGLGFPIPFYIAHKIWPRAHFDKVFTPILVAELGYLSVGINSSVFTSFLFAIWSQWYMRKYRPRWFRKYNFLLSAALDGGAQVMVFVWSFAVGGASGTAHYFPNWALNPKGNPDYCKRLTD